MNRKLFRRARAPEIVALAALIGLAGFWPAAPARAASRLAADVHTKVYREKAAAVVGISCKGKPPTEGGDGNYFGTGVVIAPDGLVLTVTTVVPADAREIKVYFIDGRVLPGDIVRLDKESEGVLVKVKAGGLTTMRLADSSQVKPGAPAYTWGNPFLTIIKDGMVSLSSGTVSGVYPLSSVDNESRYMGPALETDAAVNPGSDGGPLTDADGNLLGLQSLAYSRTRWLGTAVPVHRLAQALPELRALGYAPPPSFAEPNKAQAWAVERALAQVAETAAPAVVSIRVLREGEEALVPENRRDEKLSRLDPYPESLRRNLMEMARPAGGYASGFIASPEGLVLTSAFNVREDARVREKKIRAIYVFLADGARFSARVLGRDSFYDLAALQIENLGSRKLPALSVRAGGPLRQGEAVTLLGRSETGGALTINSGIISATGRQQGTGVQISALMNYGNLGGPVLDLEGRLVGLANRLHERTPWRQNCGVGFMTEADNLQKVLPDLQAGRTIARPKRAYLGVQGDVGALDIKGARVNQVMKGSAADQAGLEAGDIITEFNGQEVGDWPGLVRAIQSAKAGDVVTVKVKRDDEVKEFQVTLGEME